MENTTKPTLLIADDETDLRNALVFDFKRKGYNVLSADNGKDAFQLVLSAKVDIVISDIRMPGGDGVELLKRLKENHPRLPVVIFVTGHADIGPDEAYERGAEAIFSKPFDRKALHKTVEAALMPLEKRWAPSQERASADGRKLEGTFAGFDEAKKQKKLLLGRGGFFVAKDSDFPKVGEVVVFRFTFSSDKALPEVAGIGIVRWTRSQKIQQFSAGIGVEIISLSEGCRKQVVELVEAQSENAVFIPRG
jgi:CheY-like chemotaxis protein